MTYPAMATTPVWSPLLELVTVLVPDAFWGVKALPLTLLELVVPDVPALPVVLTLGALTPA